MPVGPESIGSSAWSRRTAVIEPVIIAAPLLIAAIVMSVRFVGCGLNEVDPVNAYTPYSSTVLSMPNLISFWRLNDPTTGPPVAHDSKDSNDGLYEAGVTRRELGLVSDLSNDSDNYAALFDGSTGFVEIPFAANVNPSAATGFAVEALVYVWEIDPNNPRVIVSSFDSTLHTGYALALNGADFVATVGTGSGTVFAIVHAEAPKPRETYYVAMTYVGGSLELFVNPLPPEKDFDYSARKFVKQSFIDDDPGNTMYDQNSGTYAPQTTRMLQIGAGFGSDASPGKPFYGVIQNVAVYSPPLSFDDIVNHYFVFSAGYSIAPPGTSPATFSSEGSLWVDAAFPGMPSQTDTFNDAGGAPGAKRTYTIPYWCTSIDLILLGGGAGGEHGTFAGNAGGGGNAGQWTTKTIRRIDDPQQSDQIPWTTTSITVVLGAGGPGGKFSSKTAPANGIDTTVTVAGLLFSASGGSGLSGLGQPGAAVKPDPLQLNGANFTGGAVQTTADADGNDPGGGGAGGAGGFAPGDGGDGAAGSVWIVARQT